MLTLAVLFSPLLPFFAVPLGCQLVYALLVAPPAAPMARSDPAPGLTVAGIA
jgi:hypothetical protein